MNTTLSQNTRYKIADAVLLAGMSLVIVVIVYGSFFMSG